MEKKYINMIAGKNCGRTGYWKSSKGMISMSDMHGAHLWATIKKIEGKTAEMYQNTNLGSIGLSLKEVVDQKLSVNKKYLELIAHRKGRGAWNR